MYFFYDRCGIFFSDCFPFIQVFVSVGGVPVDNEIFEVWLLFKVAVDLFYFAVEEVQMVVAVFLWCCDGVGYDQGGGEFFDNREDLLSAVGASLYANQIKSVFISIFSFIKDTTNQYSANLHKCI